jgi:hypothetical protein
MAMAELVGRRGRRQTSILIWDLYKGAQNIRAMHSSRKRGKIIPEGVIGNEVNKLQIAVPSTKMYETRNAVQIYVLDRTFLPQKLKKHHAWFSSSSCLARSQRSSCLPFPALSDVSIKGPTGVQAGVSCKPCKQAFSSTRSPSNGECIFYALVL